ncbi:MAG TPA: chemotaxis protein CheW, partial [Pseudomonas sp.]|nr:chemotaxis protein CheW [Pseudomonas sp.]
MSRTVLTETRSQQALQSYLDALLQDAAIELAVDSVSQDEFQAAVLEEQLRDTRVVVPQAEPVQPAVVESATVVPV